MQIKNNRTKSNYVTVSRHMQFSVYSYLTFNLPNNKLDAPYLLSSKFLHKTATVTPCIVFTYYLCACAICTHFPTNIYLTAFN